MTIQEMLDRDVRDFMKDVDKRRDARNTLDYRAAPPRVEVTTQMLQSERKEGELPARDMTAFSSNSNAQGV